MKTILLHITLLLLVVNSVSAQHPANDTSLDSPVSSGESLQRTQMVLPAIYFDENPYNHNMHITSNGDYYFTINGGSSGNGQINKFDMNGVLLQTYPILIDGRGLSFNTADGYLYASLYMGDIVRITDLTTGTFTTIFSAIMQNAQASFAISPDGSKFYNFFQGTLLIHDFATGAVLNTITGLQFGTGNFGGEAAVAVDASRIFTWNSTLKTVYIYDTTGTLMQTMPLDSGDNGHSLSVSNGYLFVSRDGNYAVGTWYGYNISSTIGLESPAATNAPIILSPNPATNLIHIQGIMHSLEIYNMLGEKMISLEKEDSHDLDVSAWPRGMYFAKINNGNSFYTRKLLLE